MPLKVEEVVWVRQCGKKARGSSASDTNRHIGTGSSITKSKAKKIGEVMGFPIY